MLKGIPSILSPDLLHVLRAMGHGDTIVIADANFPAEANGRRCIRLDGLGATDVADAMLALLPVDSFIDHPVLSMQVVGDPDAVPEIVGEFQAIVDRHEGRSVPILAIERHAFYETARRAFAIVQTGETRLYGNLIITKGVIGT